MDILLGIATSLHLGLGGDYNSLHPHLRFKDNYTIAGVYYNSEYTTSYYMGLEFEYDKFNLETGIVTGYSDADVMPFARLTYDIDSTTRYFIAPGLENGNYGLVIGIETWIK